MWTDLSCTHTKMIQYTQNSVIIRQVVTILYCLVNKKKLLSKDKNSYFPKYFWSCVGWIRWHEIDAYLSYDKGMCIEPVR